MRLSTLESVPLLHSRLPYMMFVMTPYLGTRLFDWSAADDVQVSVMTAWHEGFGHCEVIQNHKAILNEMTGSVCTRSGLFRRANPKASPTCP
ncbi:hypothetical protein CsSME_00051695 [Camellia sinensis var. sinensis]